MAAQFQAFGDTINALPTPSGWTDPWPPTWNGTLCGAFTGGGTKPPTYYSTFVHPLWSRDYGSGAVNGCTDCHSVLSGNAADTHAALLDPAGLGDGGIPVTVNEADNSLLFKHLMGLELPRMPYNCPIPSRRCLNHAGGTYDPASDTDPTSTTTEIDRIVYWINNGAAP